MAPGVSTTNVSPNRNAGERLCRQPPAMLRQTPGSGPRTSSDGTAVSPISTPGRQQCERCRQRYYLKYSLVFMSTPTMVVYELSQSRHLHVWPRPIARKSERLHWNEAEKDRAERNCHGLPPLAMPRYWRASKALHSSRASCQSPRTRIRPQEGCRGSMTAAHHHWPSITVAVRSIHSRH